MDDFRGSLAQQNVQVSTEVVTTSVVGENFWKVLYITPEYTGNRVLAVKDTYASVVQALAGVSADNKAKITKDLQSLFYYGSDVEVYIIKPADYEASKYKAYLTYLDMEAETDTVTVDEQTVDVYKWKTTTTDMLTALATVWDSDFSHAIGDFPFVYDSTVPDEDENKTGALLAAFTEWGMDIALYARGVESTLAWKGTSLALGFSPSLYQLGRTLGVLNSTGTSVGNSMDMAACDMADVLPNRNTSTAELTGVGVAFANWFDDLNITFFKPLGNQTNNVVAYGGWTLKNSALPARWIEKYSNYIIRVAVAEVLAVINTYKNSITYNKILGIIDRTLEPFVSLGRLKNYKNTAPAFNLLPKTNGHTINIPNAWEAWFVDDLRDIKIGGTLYVEA